MTTLNYNDLIPNNIDLSTDKSLQRALEHWQPKFKGWWNEMGPEGFQSQDVYLRTATSVDSNGWDLHGKRRLCLASMVGTLMGKQPSYVLQRPNRQSSPYNCRLYH